MGGGGGEVEGQTGYVREVDGVTTEFPIATAVNDCMTKRRNTRYETSPRENGINELAMARDSGKERDNDTVLHLPSLLDYKSVEFDQFFLV